MISYVDLKNIHVLQTNQQQQQQSKLVNKETKKQQQQQQQQTKKRKIADGRDKIAIIQPVLRRTYLVQCKVIRKPKFGICCLWNPEWWDLESRILSSSNPESHERLEMESKFRRQGIRIRGGTTRSPESKLLETVLAD